MAAWARLLATRGPEAHQQGAVGYCAVVRGRMQAHDGVRVVWLSTHGTMSARCARGSAEPVCACRSGLFSWVQFLLYASTQRFLRQNCTERKFTLG